MHISNSRIWAEKIKKGGSRESLLLQAISRLCPGAPCKEQEYGKKSDKDRNS